jgi:hypothetical protein
MKIEAIDFGIDLEQDNEELEEKEDNDFDIILKAFYGSYKEKIVLPEYS